MGGGGWGEGGGKNVNNPENGSEIFVGPMVLLMPVCVNSSKRDGKIRW